MKREFTQVDEALVRRAAEVLRLLEEQRCAVVTAESCTGRILYRRA